MRKDIDLSDKIQELFRLKADSFSIETHLPLARDIVLRFGRTKSISIFADTFHLFGHSDELDRMSNSVGDYIVRYEGPVYLSHILGNYPKLVITGWKDYKWGSDYSEYPELAISYNDSNVKCVAKISTYPYHFYIPLWFGVAYHFTVMDSKELWSARL